MAIIWEDKVVQSDGSVKRYQVRTAGNTRRLYTNGVFHSQFNPAKPISGSVWDLLFLPSFIVERGRPLRVLVLGVGGGSVIRLIQHFLAVEQIIGVDLDRHHLHVAKTYFGVNHDSVALIEGNAIEYVDHYQGPEFDLIIDDLFGDDDGEPERAVEVTESWFNRLASLLSSTGMLVFNFDRERAYKKSDLSRNFYRQQGFAQLAKLTTPLYENFIVALGRSPLSGREFLSKLREYPELDDRRASCRLNYRIRWQSL